MLIDLEILELNEIIDMLNDNSALESRITEAIEVIQEEQWINKKK